MCAICIERLKERTADIQSVCFGLLETFGGLKLQLITFLLIIFVIFKSDRPTLYRCGNDTFLRSQRLFEQVLQHEGQFRNILSQISKSSGALEEVDSVLRMERWMEAST